MKTSINFKEAKTDSESHNFRKKNFAYVRQDLTVKNEYWFNETIAEKRKNIENYCKEKSGRKLQKNAMPIREAVVVIKENTTMLELQSLSQKLKEELGIKIFQIVIHKDEGHYDTTTKEWKPNYHAHLVADWQDPETGKTLKHKPFHYSKMQDITAECLGMDRGVANSRARLEAIQFKIKKKEEEYENILKKYENLNTEIIKSSELVVKKTDLLGFKRIETEKTIEKFDEKFKMLTAEQTKINNDLMSQNQKLGDKEKTIHDIKHQNSTIENNIKLLFSNPEFYDREREKYLKSVAFLLEQKIDFQLALDPHRERNNFEDVRNEIFEIAEKLADKNNIPLDSFKSLFGDKFYFKKITELLLNTKKNLNKFSINTNDNKISKGGRKI